MEKYQLFNKIYKYQKENNKSILEELIIQFNPLLKKYACKVSFEDSMQDLTITFIETICKIPLDKVNEDKFILSYIKTSIKNRYINLSLKNSKDLLLEYECENLMQYSDCNDINNVELISLLDKLSSKEKYIIYSIFFNDMPVADISKQLNISRQSVNQSKLRALKKLKKELV